MAAQNRAASSNGQHHATAVGPIDKSALPISAPRRIRDKDHLRYVASQPCLVCGRSPGHAHHIRYAQPRAMGSKVSDEWTVPLCATHHRALHTVGDEEKWWKERQIDPIIHAEQLWRERWDETASSPAAQQSKGADTSRPELNTGVYGNPGLEVLGDSGIFSLRYNNSPQRLTQGRWPDSHVTDAKARETTWRTPIATSSVHAARGATSRSIFLRRLRSATSRS
ncbi:MAG: DUF968 domain-containing protein [Gemmatimonadetes bacterium]|nr:DUF968 domain-containing protein [Gemmatimonadota bacterium]